MVKVVSWNIGKREKPWRELVQMASEGEVDVALLQEAGSPPGDVVDRIEYVDGVFWNRQLYDRWPLVVKLSDRITVEPYRQVPPISSTSPRRDVRSATCELRWRRRLAEGGRATVRAGSPSVWSTTGSPARSGIRWRICWASGSSALRVAIPMATMGTASLTTPFTSYCSGGTRSRATRLPRTRRSRGLKTTWGAKSSMPWGRSWR